MIEKDTKALKRFLKRKVKVTLGLVVSFLITGSIGFAETIDGVVPQKNEIVQATTNNQIIDLMDKITGGQNTITISGEIGTETNINGEDVSHQFATASNLENVKFTFGEKDIVITSTGGTSISKNGVDGEDGKKGEDGKDVNNSVIVAGVNGNNGTAGTAGENSGIAGSSTLIGFDFNNAYGSSISGGNLTVTATGGKVADGGTGGNGGDGADGSLADATGLNIANSGGITISLGKITVEAIGSEGGNGGIGGTGGNGGTGGTGGIGGNVGTGGALGQGGAVGTNGQVGQAGSGGAGGSNNKYLDRVEGATGNDKNPGTAGVDGTGTADTTTNQTPGNTGTVAGTNPTVGTNGNGGTAEAIGLLLKNTDMTINGISEIKVTATAGDGATGNDRVDGTRGEKATAEGINLTGGTLGIGFEEGINFEVSADNGSEKNEATNITNDGGIIVVKGSGDIAVTTTAGSGNGASESDIATGIVLANSGATHLITDSGKLTITTEALNSDRTDRARSIVGTGTIVAHAKKDIEITTKVGTGGSTRAYGIDLDEGSQGEFITGGAFKLTTEALGTKYKGAHGIELSETDYFKVGATGDIAIITTAGANGGAGSATAYGIVIDNSSETKNANAIFETEKDFILKSEALGNRDKNSVGIVASKADINITAGGKVNISSNAGKGIEIRGTDELKSNLNIKGDTIAVSGKDHEYAIETHDTNVSLISTNGRTIIRKMYHADGDLNLQGKTEITEHLKLIGTDLYLKMEADKNTALNVGFNLTLIGTDIFFYNGDVEREGTNYGTIEAGSLSLYDENKVTMRTDLLSGEGDKIKVTGDVEGNGNLNISLFDQGMKNGYYVKDGKIFQGDKEIDEYEETVLVDVNGTTTTTGKITVEDVSYDNGAWEYDYKLTADKKVNIVKAPPANEDIVIKEINLVSAKAGKLQYNAHDSYVASYDMVAEASRELMTNVLERHEDGVWAEYLNGELKSGEVRENEIKYNGAQVGFEKTLGENFNAGLAFTYAKGDAEYVNAGDGNVENMAGSAYLGYEKSGHQVGLVATVGKADTDVTTVAGTITEKLDSSYDNDYYGVALGYGYKAKSNDGWTFEPNLQVAYTGVDSSEYDAKYTAGTAKVKNEKAESLIVRGGVTLGKELESGSKVYAKLAVFEEMEGEVETTVSADNRTETMKSDLGGTEYEYGLGVNFAVKEDAGIYVEVSHTEKENSSKDYGVKAGFEIKF